MRTITVRRAGGGHPDAGDVLDYAIVKIEEYGWHKYDAANPNDWKESSDEVGYTLHDAIGAACTALSRAAGSSSGKDWTYTPPGGTTRYLRTEATKLVQDQLPAGEDDKTFNDKATDVNEILEVLRAARAAADREVTV